MSYGHFYGHEPLFATIHSRPSSSAPPESSECSKNGVRSRKTEGRHRKEVVRAPGLEPGTHGLKVRARCTLTGVPPTFALHLPSVLPVV